MKQIFNFPQKKGKNYISNINEKVIIELNDVKIKNIQQLGDKGGFFFDCHITSKNNSETIKRIKELDKHALETLITNYSEWFNDEDENDINDLYINSLTSDNMMTFIYSHKIDTDIIINEEEKDINDLISFIKMNKKNKNYVIHMNLVFLGMYINNTTIINKWAIKYVEIDSLNEYEGDWNRREIEEEWKYDIQLFEEEIEKKIISLRQTVERTKELYEEIINEDNINIWENKLNNLKSVILKK